jgi:hypothetical protein
MNSCRKRTCLNSLACAAAALLILGAVVASHAQEGMGKEENYKRLQAMRVWMIIDALDVDSASEKGIALLAAINKYSDLQRELMIKSHSLMEQIFDAFKPDASVDEAVVTKLVLDLEENNRKLLEAQTAERKELIQLLTPVERAKLLIAEESFRRRLRGAMHGGGGERGKDRKP